MSDSKTQRFGVMIPVEVHTRIPREDTEPAGRGELSEWIVGAIRQVLSGELVIEDYDPSVAGRGVGKNIQIEPELLEKVLQAAEEASLIPTEWVKLAVYHRMERDFPAGSDSVSTVGRAG